MKNSRHNKIIDLITNEAINTQEGLLLRLSQCGYEVTQATISRDIRELGIHKVRSDSGKYRYISMRTNQADSMSDKFMRIFGESVKMIEPAQNIVVVKCHTGMANAACATFDAAEFGDVVGTLSGDDTFIAVMKDNESAEKITLKLRELLDR